MRDAINSPAWGILDDWREGGPERSVTVTRSASGYLITAMDHSPLIAIWSESHCSSAAELERAARDVVLGIEEKRRAGNRVEIERLRHRLAEAERAELEAASSVECAASNHERDMRETAAK